MAWCIIYKLESDTLLSHTQHFHKQIASFSFLCYTMVSCSDLSQRLMSRVRSTSLSSPLKMGTVDSIYARTHASLSLRTYLEYLLLIS